MACEQSGTDTRQPFNPRHRRTHAHAHTNVRAPPSPAHRAATLPPTQPLEEQQGFAFLPCVDPVPTNYLQSGHQSRTQPAHLMRRGSRRETRSICDRGSTNPREEHAYVYVCARVMSAKTKGKPVNFIKQNSHCSSTANSGMKPGVGRPCDSAGVTVEVVS